MHQRKKISGDKSHHQTSGGVTGSSIFPSLFLATWPRYTISKKRGGAVVKRKKRKRMYKRLVCNSTQKVRLHARPLDPVAFCTKACPWPQRGAVTQLLNKRYYAPHRKHHKHPPLSVKEHHKVRSNVERLIQDYSQRQLPHVTYEFLTKYQLPLKPEEFYALTIEVFNYLLSFTCKQLRMLQQLPYIAILNPKIEMTYSLYLKTLESMLANKFPIDLYDTEKMLQLFNEFLNDHQDTLVSFSNGLSEISDFMPAETVFNFLDKHIQNKICMKLLATHYINMLEDNEACKRGKSTGRLGILRKDLHIASFIQQIHDFVNDLCALTYDNPRIELVVTEGNDITFSCIPIVLEYVMTEILKNSMRATIERDKHERHMSLTADSKYKRDSSGHIPHEFDVGLDPIELGLYKNGPEELVIKVSDRGNGIPPRVRENIFKYSYTTMNEQLQEQQELENMLNIARSTNTTTTNSNAFEDSMLPGEKVKNVAGMGFGLPLCKSYLELLEGSIEVQSLWGLGTDVYIRLTGPGKQLD